MVSRHVGRDECDPASRYTTWPRDLCTHMKTAGGLVFEDRRKGSPRNLCALLKFLYKRSAEPKTVTVLSSRPMNLAGRVMELAARVMHMSYVYDVLPAVHSSVGEVLCTKTPTSWICTPEMATGFRLNAGRWGSISAVPASRAGASLGMRARSAHKNAHQSACACIPLPGRIPINGPLLRRARTHLAAVRALPGADFAGFPTAVSVDEHRRRQNVIGKRAVMVTSGASGVSPAPSVRLKLTRFEIRYEYPTNSVPRCSVCALTTY
jgi:hypothetical protein